MNKIACQIVGFIFASALFCMPVVAQKQAIRDEIETQRIAFLTNRMNLTSDEAQKFWPVFNEYIDKKEVLTKERNKLLLKYNQNLMTDGEMDAALTRYVQINKADASLLEEYNKKFRLLLPAKKVIALYVGQEEFRSYLLKQIKERSRNRKAGVE